MSDPVSAVYQDGIAVNKGGVRDYETSREILVLTSAAEIQSLTIPTRKIVAAGRDIFVYDSADTTSPHGTSIIVSADGRRYRRILTLENATTDEITAVLSSVGLGADGIVPGGANRFLGTTGANETTWLTVAQIADLLDSALGSSDWREGAGSVALSSRVDYLPANSWTGMIGGQARLVQMGDGSVMVCGEGSKSFNGDVALNNRGSMRFLGIPSGVTVAAGKIYMANGAGYFIDSDGWPWSWGRNAFGGLGHGDTVDRPVPKRIEWFVSNNFKVASIFPCLSGSVTEPVGAFFLEDGVQKRAVYCGEHTYGQAGDGSTAGGSKTSPVIVGGGTPLTDIDYLYASATNTTVLARKSNGAWYGWGANTTSCLGISGTNFTSPQALTAMQGWVKAVCCAGVTIALTDDGGARTAGRNNEGELGVGSTGTLSGWQTPTGLAGDVVDVGGSQTGVATMWAITEPSVGSRYLWAWGSNAYGAVGDGTTTNRTSPYQPTGPFQGNVVAALTAASYTPSVGSFSALFARTTTKVYGAGYNANMNLCNGQSASVSTFTEVLGVRGTISDFATHGYQQYSGLIVLTDRGCFSGGYNATGAAGIGPTLLSEPVLQQLDVPAVMGPQGAQGIPGPAGTGSGDMVRSIYDPDADGKVISAQSADSVPWSGITARPSTVSGFGITDGITDSDVGAADGVAPLGSDSKVPAAYLPSYVDDVVEAATFAALPGTGETGKIYAVIDTNKVYRWSGSAYVVISASPGSTDAVTEGATNLYFTVARVLQALADNPATARTNMALAAVAASGQAQDLDRGGLQSLGQQVVGSLPYTLTAANAGRNVLIVVSGGTITLPLASAVGSGGTITLKNVTSATVTMALAGSDSWDAASATLGAGQTIMFTSDGGVFWRAMVQENALSARIVGGANISTSVDSQGRLVLSASGTVSAAAADVSVAPTGDISSTNAQAALAELDSEKAPKSNPTFSGGQVLPASGGFKFIKCITLATNTDLDGVTDAGFYDLDSPTNGPYAGVGWGYLDVIRHSGSAQFCIQRFTHLFFGREVTWQRRKVSNVWGPWQPTSGYVTPAHFGATGGSTLSGASTDDTTAIGKWLDYGIANQGIPLVLDQFYKITSAISKDISGVNGFGIRSLGAAARAGIYMSGTTAQLAFSGANQSNPSGFDADQYHFADFLIGIDANRSNFLLGISAEPDSGSDAPGLHMQNVHVRRSGDGYGVTGDTFYFQDIRQFEVHNVSAQGKYFGYAGNMFRLAAAAGGAPVEGSFTNCRSSHFQKMFKFDASSGATASDDWQGMHLDRCSAIAVDMLVHAQTGSEGFSEWLTIDRCHAYFREIGVYGENVGNVKVGNSYFLGHGALATIQGIALTGTSIVPMVDVSHNTIKLDPATGASRIGVNVPTMGGVAAHNRIKGQTSNNFGSLVQTDNAAF